MSSTAPRLGRSVAGVVVLAALTAAGLAACGVQSGHVAGAGEGDDTATLPTLPPVEERLPDSYDDDGCLILTEGRDCGATAPEVDQALAGDVGGRTLAGFQGPLFTTDLSADVVHVLADTVRQSTTGAWRADGLLRNETGQPVVDPRVTAVLRDASGAEVGRAEGAALVAPVRPGEPVPFSVSSPVDATTVASVEWSAGEGGGEAPVGTRDLQLTTYFVEPAGHTEALDLYLYHEDAGRSRPLVLYGSISNLADVDATSPSVVAAWLGDDGRVRAVADAAAVDPSAQALDALGPGQLADFLLTVDQGDAEGLDAASMLLWAQST